MENKLALLSQSLPYLLKGTAATIQIAILSMALGLIGGILLGIVNCEKIRNPLMGAIINSFVWVIRGTPLFVQVLIIYYALPELLKFTFSPMSAGVAALGLNSMAYISEIVRGGINAIPNGQWEAAYALGFNSVKALKGIILPQTLRMTLPSLTNELTALIKETSILMIIGVGELTKVSKDIVARELDPMTIYLAAAVIYLVLTSSVSLVETVTQKKEGI